MTDLRFCFPHNFREFLSYNTKTNTFHGALAHMLYETLDVMARVTGSAAKNLTFNFQPSETLNVSLGSSENSEGCIDALQTNQSDVLFALVQYPKNAANVSQGLIIGDTIVMISSAYKKTTEVEPTQVLEMFDSFSHSLWALCLFTFFVMLVVLKLYNRVSEDQSPSAKGEHRYDSSLLACHVTRLNAISDAGPTRKIIFACASLYSLLVVHYFCSFIKTELVTIKDPPVYSSYQDIIDRGALPLFMKGMSHDAQFKSTNAGPQQRKLWKYATDKFGVDNLYIDINPITFMLAGIGITLTREVLVSDSILTPFLPASGCMAASRDPKRFVHMMENVRNGKLLDWMQSSGFEESDIAYLRRLMKRYPDARYDSSPTFNLFTSVDPEEESYHLGVAMSEHASIALREIIREGARRVVEAGFNLKIIGGLVGLNILEGHPILTSAMGEKVKSMHHLQQECESCTIIRPDIEYNAMTLGNFRTLFIVVAAILPIIFFVHIYSEHMSSIERSVYRRDRRFM